MEVNGSLSTRASSAVAGLNSSTSPYVFCHTTPSTISGEMKAQEGDGMSEVFVIESTRARSMSKYLKELGKRLELNIVVGGIALGDTTQHGFDLIDSQWQLSVREENARARARERHTQREMRAWCGTLISTSETTDK